MTHRILKSILKHTKQHEDSGSLVFGGLAILIAVLASAWILFARVPIETLTQKIDIYINVPMKSAWKNAAKTLESHVETIEETSGTTQSESNATEKQARTYRTTTSDTLWKLAIRYYNNGYRWTKIYEANKKLIPDPNKLDKDITLVIPE